MKKQKSNASCWICKQKKFKPKQEGEAGSPFCLAKNKWFPDVFDYSEERECEFFD